MGWAVKFLWARELAIWIGGEIVIARMNSLQQ